MNEMRALIATEAKLLFREPIYWLVVDPPAHRDPGHLRLDLRAVGA